MNLTTARVASLTLGALPFAFGTLRAAETGTDFRYLVTAIGSFAGAAGVAWFGRPDGRRPLSNVGLTALALVGATALGSATAVAVGARSVGAVGFVALGFAVCATASVVLRRYLRDAGDSRRTPSA